MLRSLRPLLIAVVLVLAVQPAQARLLAPAYPAQFTLVAEPAPGGDPLIGLIGAARSRVLVETAALNDPALVAALESARGRGVDVRVMTDPHSASSGSALAQLATRDVWGRRGNPAFLRTGLSALTIDRGILALASAPLTVNARTTERRFLVVDHDPLDVQQAASVFYDDWERLVPNRFGHQTVLAPPDYQTDLIALINQSTRSVDVMAEALDSPAIVLALNGAALRQVHVRLLLDPGASSNTLQSLIAAGAELGMLRLGFSGSAVGVDGSRLLIGSAALNDNSLQKQRELGLQLADGGVSGAFRNAFEADWATSRRITIATPTPTLPTVTPQVPTIQPFVPHTPTSVVPLTFTPVVPPTLTRVGASPSASRTAVPATPTLPPTASPSVLTVTPVLFGSVRIGGRQQIAIETLPGAAVTITVIYPDGTTRNEGTTQGLADASGTFRDAWTIPPSTTPGTATVQITVAAIGKRQQLSRTFTITL